MTFRLLNWFFKKKDRDDDRDDNDGFGLFSFFKNIFFKKKDDDDDKADHDPIDDGDDGDDGNDGDTGGDGTGSNDNVLTDGDDIETFIEFEEIINAQGGADQITVEAGAGTVNLGGDADTNVNVLTINGGTVTQVVGSGGDDTVNVDDTAVVDQIFLLGGKDTVVSQGLVDTIAGDEGDDTVEIQGNGAELVELNEGNDVVIAEARIGNAFGGIGDDTFEFSGGGKAFGEDGNDRFVDRGGETVFDGGKGDDEFVFDNDTNDFDTFDGGDGVDTIFIDVEDTGLTAGEILAEFIVTSQDGAVAAIDGSTQVSAALGLEVENVEFVELV